MSEWLLRLFPFNITVPRGSGWSRIAAGLAVAVLIHALTLFVYVCAVRLALTP